MNDFSVIMAITDYVPVVFFAVAAVYLQRDLYEKMSKGAFALFAAGTIDIVYGGPSTDAFKKILGEVKARELFQTIVFHSSEIKREK